VNDVGPQSALCQLRRQFQHPVTLSILAGLVATRHTRTRARRTLVTAALTGLAALVAVFAVNAVTFAYVPPPGAALSLAAQVLAISLVITGVTKVVFHALDKAHSPAPDQPRLLPILERLPLGKRGALVALSVEDHYVRIRIVKGEEKVLMRLAEAMREVGGTPGGQVHRSHWAAFGQVLAARRDGDRAILTMATGPEMPVSRANLPKIKEAGLLPR